MQRRYKILLVLTVILSIVGLGKLPDNIKSVSFLSSKSLKEFKENPKILSQHNLCSIFDQSEERMLNQKSDSVPIFSGCGGFF
jgi:Sec-independent protein translocase protein TatA